MGILKLEDIIQATGGKVIYKNSDIFTGLSIDSRTIQHGELFIAIKGKRFDGHDFLHEALDKGSGAIINKHLGEGEWINRKTVIYVMDTLRALQEVAKYNRLKREIPIVCVTGSNGKTTTKELIVSILEKRYHVLKNIGNLNNNIGLPLSLARIDETHDIGIFEMGASVPGDIKELCEIAKPDYGVLTNIGYAHLEGFKDIESVRKTKLELLEYVKGAIVNADDEFLIEGIYKYGFEGWMLKYGIKNDADIRAIDIKLYEKGSIFNLIVKNRGSISVSPKISGMFNIYNMLAAASVGYLFNIDLIDIKDAIDSFQGIPMRLEYKEINGIRIINDVYNANPSSMELAIQELVRLRQKRTIAVFGDMLELGSYSEEAHRRIGKLLMENSIDIFIAVGQLMEFAASEFKGNVYRVEDATEAGKILKEIWKQGDTVLIKGSRGMKMERVLGK